MRYLFNSRGEHIANEINGQLHAVTGKNIGHMIQDGNFFIDMKGNYMGEIVYENRLLYNTMSPYRSVNYGIHGNYGNVGNYGNPGNHGSIGLLAGYRDISSSQLK